MSHYLLRFILMLSSHLGLDFQRETSAGFLTDMLHKFCITPMHAACPVHLFVLSDLSFNLVNCINYGTLHSAVFSILLLLFLS